MSRHVYPPISLECYTFLLQKYPLATPARSRSSHNVHYTMARQQLCSWRVTQCAPHHPRMAGPTRQSGYMTIGRHPTIRNFRNNAQHIIAEIPCLFRRHAVWIVSQINYNLFHKDFLAVYDVEAMCRFFNTHATQIIVNIWFLVNERSVCNASGLTAEGNHNAAICT